MNENAQSGPAAGLMDALAQARAAATPAPPSLEECRRVAGDPLAHLSGHEWRALLQAALAEIERMKRGDFTAEEIHGFCHNLAETVSPEEFAVGCAAYQRKIFGVAPDADLAGRAGKWR